MTQPTDHQRQDLDLELKNNTQLDNKRDSSIAEFVQDPGSKQDQNNNMQCAGGAGGGGGGGGGGSSSGGFHHFRYIVIVIGGMMMGSMLFLRLCITVPMISMVNKTAIYLREHPNSTQDELEAFFPPDYVEIGEFVWTNEVQQFIMSGYMIAYSLPQLFTTRWAMEWGIRKSLAVSLAVCAISTLLTPTMAYWGWEWVLILRLVNALGGSPILPTMINVIQYWMPTHESAKGLAIFQFVCNFGYISSPLVSGYLTSLMNWKAAFYVPGVVALLISLLWYIVVEDTPESSRFLSQKELNYINGVSADSLQRKTDKVEQRTDLPWYFMFKIKSFYYLSIVWALYCCTIGGFLFLLPNYLNRILQVPVEEVGTLNFTVQVGCLFCMLWPAPAANFLQDKFNLSLTAARKILVVMTLSIVCVSYSYLALYHDNLVVIVVFNRFFHMANDTIFLATIMSQFGETGLTGLIYSMINTQGNLFIVLYCWLIGRFLDYTGETLECWSYVMYFMIFLVVSHLLVYVFFCHSEPVEVKMPPKKELEDGHKADK